MEESMGCLKSHDLHWALELDIFDDICVAQFRQSLECCLIERATPFVARRGKRQSRGLLFTRQCWQPNRYTKDICISVINSHWKWITHYLILTFPFFSHQKREKKTLTWDIHKQLFTSHFFKLQPSLILQSDALPKQLWHHISQPMRK